MGVGFESNQRRNCSRHFSITLESKYAVEPALLIARVIIAPLSGVAVDVG
jgi:hypothetical protein